MQNLNRLTRKRKELQGGGGKHPSTTPAKKARMNMVKNEITSMRPCDGIKGVTSVIIGFAYMVIHANKILYRRLKEADEFSLWMI